MPVQASRISELPGLQNPTSDALRRPEQRRKFSSTILRRVRPQVNSISFPPTMDILSFMPSSVFLHFVFFLSFSVPFQKSPTKALRKNFGDKVRLKMNVNYLSLKPATICALSVQFSVRCHLSDMNVSTASEHCETKDKY